MVATNVVTKERLEALGPAERILNMLTQYQDHMVHNRPGILIPDPQANIAVRWEPANWKLDGDQKIVYRQTKAGRKTTKTRIGILGDENKVFDGTKLIGEYRKPGLFPEVVTWMYRQVTDVWKLDNDFAAHWASWAQAQDHRDLKVILAAFMLCQTRMGEPVRGPDGKAEFNDEDFRAVGEAMGLLQSKHDFNPKLLLRIGEVLTVPGVAAINRELGFGRSARKPFLGRYPKMIEKWLCYREKNPKLLAGLIRAGFRTSVMELAQNIGYKPISATFFEMLRWKQVQAKDGRRTLAIGTEVKAADTWGGLSEQQICKRITKEHPNWKQIVGKLPTEVGLTRAIVSAAIEANCMSNADLIILTPSLEDMGLLEFPAIAAKIKQAMETADNQRAANIARRVKNDSTKEMLSTASDNATKKAIEEVTRGIRTYVVVDKSGSMEKAIETAKGYLKKFLQGFPLTRVHVSVFNTMGQEVVIKTASAAGIEQAFRGHAATGGTCYATGVECLISKYKPHPDEDALFIFVGDEGEVNNSRMVSLFDRYAVHPVAFGLLKVQGQNGEIVQWTANQLGIPCFPIEESLFNTEDPYAVTRTLRNLIAATPVNTSRITTTSVKPVRKSLVQEILECPLLQKPNWA